MPLNWFTKEMIKRNGQERYHFLTTHPAGRGGPKQGWKWHPVTEALVHLSVACGFDEIKETNALEIARRIAIYEQKNGERLVTWDGSSKDPSPVYITFEDVWNHVGLATNASSLSRKEFQERWGPLMGPRFGESAHDRIERHHAAMTSKAALAPATPAAVIAADAEGTV